MMTRLNELHRRDAVDSQGPSTAIREPLPEETKGYQWPADKLTVQDMANLAELARKPINQLLHAAVSALYVAMTGEDPFDSTPPPPRKQEPVMPRDLAARNLHGIRANMHENGTKSGRLHLP